MLNQVGHNNVRFDSYEENTVQFKDSTLTGSRSFWLNLKRPTQKSPVEVCSLDGQTVCINYLVINYM